MKHSSHTLDFLLGQRGELMLPILTQVKFVRETPDHVDSYWNDWISS